MRLEKLIQWKLVSIDPEYAILQASLYQDSAIRNSEITLLHIGVDYAG